jgi:hypothetical protein
MRTLSHLGLLSEDASHRFALTPLGEALKSGAPGAARASVLTLASESWMRGFAQLPYSVQTGKSGFEKLFGMPVFDWLAQRPEDASLFSETMVGIHGAEPAAVAKAYDFSGMKTIVDVGGATGHLLATILEKNPASRGILYDLPHVVRDAPPVIAARGLADRMKIEAGSFFDSIPAGGDAYLLSHIRVPALAHHSRLVGAAVPDDPRPLPASDEADEPTADHRDGTPAGRRAASGQDARHDDAGRPRRAGADGSGVRRVARQGGDAPDTGCADGVTGERGGGEGRLEREDSRAAPC